MAFLLRKVASLFILAFASASIPHALLRKLTPPLLTFIRSTARHWASRQLSQLEALLFAKRVLDHTMPPSSGGLHTYSRNWCLVSCRFFAGLGAPPSLPCRLTFTLPWAQVGTHLVDLHLEAMLDSLRANIIARLLEHPRRRRRLYCGTRSLSSHEEDAVYGHPRSTSSRLNGQLPQTAPLPPSCTSLGSQQGPSAQGAVVS